MMPANVIGGDVAYLTDTIPATRPGLCSSLRPGLPQGELLAGKAVALNWRYRKQNNYLYKYYQPYNLFLRSNNSKLYDLYG